MSHLQLALKPSETDGAAPASGWRARPRIAEDTLVIALTRAFAQAEMPHGPLFEDRPADGSTDGLRNDQHRCSRRPL